MTSRKKYIPTQEFWRSMFLQPSFCGRWTVKGKVPISQIKIDKSLFSFQNEVDLGQVNSMVVDFNVDLWIPIMVNPDFFLLDGQHRLNTAERLGLKYIDVVVDYVDEATVVKKKPHRRGWL